MAIFAHETARNTTSGAAAAIWFPYDAEPADKVIPWGLATYHVLVDLARDPLSGVSMLELRTFSRTNEIQIPNWAIPLGAHSVISSEVEESLTINSSAFKSGFRLTVPLMDTTIYLDYLANRFQKAGGSINGNVRFVKLEDVDHAFELVINCAGIGARTLVYDVDLEPHRGQIAVVPKIDNLRCAIVCDEAPLTYAIPRAKDCVLGGTNELSEDRQTDPAMTARFIAECSRILKIDKPKILAERVGLRPFRKSGVRLELGKLRNGRTVIHNYGHGGAGFTLSWGCAQEVVDLIKC
jgi:D-amino-acid oxidase